MILGDLKPFNEIEFVRQSRQLDLLARGDFSPIAEEIAAAYPNTNLPIRAIPFVSRYVAELTGFYARPVVRRFNAAIMPAATWQTLQNAYTASKVDAAMSAVEQALWTQNTVFMLPMPDGLGRVRLTPLLPWQLERVEVNDPLRADDPRSWSKVWFQVPVSVVSQQVIYGRLELTPFEAWRHVGGKRVGVYSANGTHPFGRIPLAVAHRVTPDPGRATAPLNEAVLNLQIALSLQQADNELIVRHCAFPQKVIEGGDVSQLTETITLGPDKVHVLVKSGNPDSPNPTLKIVQGQVPVAELVSFAEHQIRLYCAMLGLDPSAFLRVNTSVTASARLFAAQDRAAQRDKILPVLAQFETDLLGLIVQVLSLSQPLPVPPDLDVSVTYNMQEPSPDPLHDAQAQAEQIKIGAISPVDIVANALGVSRSQALSIVTRNIQESRDLGILADIVMGSAAAVAEGAKSTLPAGDTGTQVPTVPPAAGGAA